MTDLVNELKEFIVKNKDKKTSNEAVDKRIYDKVLDRQKENKRTNVKAITSTYKLFHYYLAGRMLNSHQLCRSIFDYIYDLTSYSTARDFENMFSEVEIEFPDYRIVDSSKVAVVDSLLIYKDGDKNIEITLDNDIVLHKLLKHEPHLDPNAWKNFECEMKAPIGSISINVPWIFEGTIKYDKNTGEYKASNVTLVASYPTQGKNLICRYSGLHRSAWINVVSIDSSYSSGRSEVFQNCDWDGDNINKGTIYIGTGHNTIASIKGDFDGYYNNISFDKLRDLLNKIS